MNKIRDGFTLIELVIIMVILGVLAAVAIPKLGGTIDSSEIAAEDAVIGNLRSSLEVYAMDKVVEDSERSYPIDPFTALDNDLGSSWTYAAGTITHTRNDESTRTWTYSSATGTVTVQVQ